jgi:hypothetical protein
MWNIAFALSLALALLIFLSWTSSLQPYVSSVSESCIIPSVISGFHSEVDENSVLLGCYATSSGSFLQTFRDNITVPSSRFKNLKYCTETSVRNYHYSLSNNPEERSYHVLGEVNGFLQI